MPEVIEPKTTWEPNPGGQWFFLRCPHWEVLTDGDRGGGKTSVLLNSFLMYVGAGFGSDWNGIIFRLYNPDLKDIIAKSKVIINGAFPGSKFNKKDQEWTFETGETLAFRHLENIKAYDQYHGHSYPFIGFEELTNWPDHEPYEAMLSCSRPPSANPDIPLITRATTNSFGSGYQWVKSRFIDGKKPFVAYGDEGMKRARIPIYWEENVDFVKADPNYHKRLSATLSDENKRKAWLEGSWDIVAGGRFSGVWLESVHYIEPFNIPSNWNVDRSHDWGSSKPYATLWYAESNGEQIEDGRSWPKGTLFVINEDYGCQGEMGEPNWKPNVGVELGPADIAKRVKQTEQEMLMWGLIKKQPRPGPGDDPLFDVSRGESMASTMAKQGVVWLKPSKGPGSRITGWQLIEDRLKASRQHPMEEPGLFVFNTCRHLRRTLPILPRDPKKPDDVQSDSEDHLLDSLRLKCLSYRRGNVVRSVSL